MSLASTRSPRRVVVVGSSNTDLMIRVERIPAIGETVIGGTLHTAGGGKGANQAVAAARAGASVRFVGKVGEDAFGRAALAHLRKEGIRLDALFTDPKAATGVAFIFVAKNGDNSIAVASGANLRLTAAEIARADSAFRQGDVLLVQLEAPMAAVRAAVLRAADRGMRVILNPAPARALPAALLRRVDILTPNQREAEALTGIRVGDADSAAEAAILLRKGGVKASVITLGSRGAYLDDGVQGTWVPAFKVKAVDTTGAGDVFNGALAASLAGGARLLEAVRFAQAAAALSVTRLGAQPSAPRRSEILRMLSRG